MFIGENWFLLECKPEIIDESHPVEKLDAAILTKYVLDPILGISDLKSDDNVEFISGIHSLEKMEGKIKGGEFKIGFFLHPVTVDEIKSVADDNLTMPPKSTWIEPKLRSGLTIYNINE